MRPDLAFFGAVGSFGAELVELSTTRRSVSVDPHDTLYICSFVSRRRATYRVGGRLLDREEFGPGETLVQPMGVEFGFDMKTETKSVGLFVPKTVLDGTLGEHVANHDRAFDALIGSSFRSSLVLTLLERLRGDTVNRSPHGRFVGDEMLRAIVTELYTLAYHDTPVKSTGKYLLSAPTIDRVDEYVQEHLDSQITIAELAEHAGMPAAEFAASLKETTGITPYQ